MLARINTSFGLSFTRPQASRPRHNGPQVLPCPLHNIVSSVLHRSLAHLVSWIFLDNSTILSFQIYYTWHLFEMELDRKCPYLILSIPFHFRFHLTCWSVSSLIGFNSLVDLLVEHSYLTLESVYFASLIFAWSNRIIMPPPPPSLECNYLNHFRFRCEITWDRKSVV